MRNTIVLAIATTLALSFASSAFAGEGSPDLALPSYSSHENDPAGSNYANEPDRRTFGPAYVAPRGRPGRAQRSGENTGEIIRRDRYEEDNGITGE